MTRRRMNRPSRARAAAAVLGLALGIAGAAPGRACAAAADTIGSRYVSNAQRAAVTIGEARSVDAYTSCATAAENRAEIREDHINIM